MSGGWGEAGIRQVIQMRTQQTEVTFQVQEIIEEITTLYNIYSKHLFDFFFEENFLSTSSGPGGLH